MQELGVHDKEYLQALDPPCRCKCAPPSPLLHEDVSAPAE